VRASKDSALGTPLPSQHCRPHKRSGLAPLKHTLDSKSGSNFATANEEAEVDEVKGQG